MNIWKTKTPAQIEDAAEHTQLKKNLTAFDLAALGIGSVVGTGIFVATGQGTQLAGPGVLLSFIIAAITCGFCALTYSELACMFPVAGSTYSYSYVAFGEVIAWIIGWDLMLEYLVAASAVASGWSTTFIGILENNIGIHLPKALLTPPITTVNGKIVLSGGVVDVPAILITLAITWILFIGIRESAKINNIIVLVKILVIVLFVVFGIFHVSLANLKPLMPFGWKGVMAGAAIIFFAYIGFDAVSTAAEETKNPKKDVPRGLMLCLGVVIVLYVSVAFVLTGIVPYKLIDVGNALPAALGRVGGFAARMIGAIVALGAVIGMISTLLVTLYGQIRIFMVMARDGLLPPAFAKVHPKHRTPHLCTWITGIATAAIAGLFPLPMIIDLCNIGTLFAFVLVSVGVVLLRKTRPEVERKFKTPGVPFTPLITVAFCFYLMYSLPKITWIRFGFWLFIGLAIYVAYGVEHSKLQVIRAPAMVEKVKGLGWKIYFGLFCAVTFLTLLVSVGSLSTRSAFGSGLSTAALIWDILVWLVCSLFMYSWIWAKRIEKLAAFRWLARVWSLQLFLAPIGLAVVAYSYFVRHSEGALSPLVSILFALPALYVVYRLAWKSPLLYRPEEIG